MKLTFNINYRTDWGESLYISGNCAPLGAGVYDDAVKMELHGTEHWTASVEVPDDIAAFEYHYEVRSDNAETKFEWGKPHRFNRGRTARIYCVYDSWQNQPHDKPYYSAAFTDCICKRASRIKEAAPRQGYLTIQVFAPMISPDCHLAIVGSSDSLGKWNPDNAIAMSDAEYPLWGATIPIKEITPDTEYKFIILDNDNKVVSWEGDNNRRIGISPATDAATIISGLRFVNPQSPWKGAGTAIPVFSLRSEEDFGVGDFFDLIKMIDWCASTGQTFLQLLPINDTTMTHTWQDSYPYNANSCFALHPMFLRLEELGLLADKDRRSYYDNLRNELNSLLQVDYERVNQAKIEYFHEIFAQEGERTVKSADFKSFVAKNEHWLMPYAAFCVLRDKFGTPVFANWGEYARYDKTKIAKFIAENPKDINYVLYLQYHLDKQMRHVHEYAKQKGIAIKGDIPIGISRDSVDAWTDTHLFFMESQAGAPPDDFSVLGQNWGFPTYNWEEMAHDGFAWWKARFRKMSEYFDAYRIDHILGFFRIWQIPIEAVHGLLGIFHPALPFTPDELRYNYDFWIDVDLHSTPYIMDSFLHDFFGEYTEEARDRFMYAVSYGRYKLKDPYTTQRGVSEYFATQEKNDKNTRLCQGLTGLIDQVLFIEDPYEKGKYHPRISAQYTYTYRALNDYERWCFDRLYNDFFYRRHNDFWYGKAMWKLPPLINATDMLTCAEDLGMIPACVPAVLSQLEILTLEIQRMPKDPATAFGDTWNYPYYSVCTTSTHDMGGIRAWWEEERDKMSDFYHNVLHLGGDAPYFAEPWVCEKIIEMQAKSPSMLCILPLADWLSMDGDLRRDNPADEIINVPANPRHYWRYRMHLTLDQLLNAHSFNDRLTGIIKNSGR
ncbi:MAG: 4-alpha-glucanotransferase [Muribaculaceae bacterium]|nr:4-alpha-glucanotransferase [Muribaculaceae bacterium]